MRRGRQGSAGQSESGRKVLKRAAKNHRSFHEISLLGRVMMPFDS
jgi:hypothetical protein